MPNFNITLEDTSPMIRYSSGWTAGSSINDPLADQYSEKTFTLTQKQGESMQFNFYGTGVTIFGAVRPNHGLYQAELDSGPVFTGNGSVNPPLFNQVLYTGGNATLDFRSVTLTNQQNAFIDVDYITFETNVGKDGEELIVNSFEDDHPAFAYTPASSWSTSPDQLSWFSGSTGHKACISSDAIALYGPVGPSGADYSVQIDNNTPSIHTASNSFYKPREVLFYAGNLGPGNHTLQIQISSASLAKLAIDYADVYTTASLGGSFLGSSTPNVRVIHETKPSTGIIVGLALTSALALLAILARIYLLWRLRRETTAKENEIVPLLLPPTPTMSAATPHGNSISITSTSVSPYPLSNDPPPDQLGTSSSSSAQAMPSVSSARAASPPASGYMPQGKRNAAALAQGAYSAVPTEEPRGGEANPPLYTEGT
ncbi:hypothetical protein D9613_000214 [Agrocybe pediades]|uniref:Transmembrane protein n=1 Tax=Agrocybe pediades TaxID=84607 RepID=A0A8H4R070_9AGAR|nr:hypothetical protein D9613_000214 [Agrocybe pediades]